MEIQYTSLNAWVCTIFTVSQYSICICAELTDALVLVDTGSTKKETLLRSKFAVTYELAKEPHPVQRSVISLCIICTWRYE